MFVLRAKARLSDASGEIAALGLTGPQSETWLGDAAQLAVWGKRDVGEASVVRLPDAALPDGRVQRRFAWLGPVAAAGSVASELPALPLQHWQWLEVQSGVAMTNGATVEQFVPQMLNYELVGGVDFKKGCYPGQEIVARSQYRGTIKRRATIVHSATELAAGTEVFSSSDPSQPAGLVAQAAPNPLGGFSAIVEIKLSALEGGTLHLGSSDGPTLTLGRLPYSVPTEPAAAA
jgi:folate-binding protein YgfZ